MDNMSAFAAAAVTESISTAGTDWLWVVTGISLASFLGVLVLCFTTPDHKRVFHYLLTVALLAESVCYFAEARGLGWSAVDGQQIFFVRYINWAVAFPTVALALGLLAGVSWVTILTNVAIAWLWVLCYLAAAYTPTSSGADRWGFFAFGTLSWLVLAMSTLNESRESAARVGVVRDYMYLAAWANLVWLLVVIECGLGIDGAGAQARIGATGTAIFAGVLDILFLPVLTAAFVALSRNWDFNRLRLELSDFRVILKGQDTDVELNQTADLEHGGLVDRH